MNPPPDPLDPLLDRWSNLAEPPAGLPAEVWQRIALADHPAIARPHLRDVIEAWFARPSFAVMFVASCAILGLFVAEIRVNELQHRRSAQLARSYLQLIDPLLNAPEHQREP